MLALSIQSALDIGAYACLYKLLEIKELLNVLDKIRRKELICALGRRVERAMER